MSNVKIEDFSIDKMREGYNVWKEESYENIILTKAYDLYPFYIRKGMTLIGQEERIGKITYFSGNAYRGMGAMGCSFNRARGVGLLIEENLMYETLEKCGLATKTQPIRKKGLTANTYKLVCKTNNKTTEIGLLGDDGSYIDLNLFWATQITENFN